MYFISPYWPKTFRNIALYVTLEACSFLNRILNYKQNVVLTH